MKRRGYYEKKIEDLERGLERLKEAKEQIYNQEAGAETVLISPFLLQELIKDEERKNRKLLKLGADSQEEIYAETKRKTVTGGNGKSE